MFSAPEPLRTADVHITIVFAAARATAKANAIGFISLMLAGIYLALCSATDCCDKVASPHGLALGPTAAPYHAGRKLCHHRKVGRRCPFRVKSRHPGHKAPMSALHPKADIG
jgi:hypothetical protein